MKAIPKIVQSVLSPKNPITKFLLVETDKHSGHSLGLTPPDVKILNKDGTLSPPSLTETQKYLYEQRMEYLDEVKTTVGARPIIYLDLGDPCHGTKHRDKLITTRDADQIEIAVQCAWPIFTFRGLKAYRQLAGTDAHAFGEHSAEISVTRRLQDKYSHKDINIRSHGDITINSRTFDVAHHGPGIGRKLWTETNAAQSYLRDAMLKDLRMGKPPADVYLRGHVHGYLRVWQEVIWGGTPYRSHLIIVPSWCGMNSYAQQVTGSSPYLTNGLVLFELRGNGDITIHPYINTIDIRQKESF